MSEIDEIKADEVVTMTSLLTRAFKLSGCDPVCHCCYKEIKIGDVFKLSEIKSIANIRHAYATPETNDEMLCVDCTPRMLIGRRRKLHNETVTYHKAQGGGFTRKHKG